MPAIEEVEAMMRELGSFNKYLENLDQLTRLNDVAVDADASRRFIFVQDATFNTVIQAEKRGLESGELARDSF